MSNFDVLEEKIVQLLNKLKENHLLINQLEIGLKELEQESASLKKKILELKKENVSIKATTTEGLGFTGRQEGISCYCVATIKQEN